MRISVFTTSYPRHPEDHAGRFVYDQVIRIKERGHSVKVIKPGVFRDFGLCYGEGGGLISNVKRKPWLAPLLILSMVYTLRKEAKNSDLIHAHWMAGALIARFCGRPFVVTLHGSGTAGRFSDLGLINNYPSFVHWLLKPASTIICVSKPLQEAIRLIGLNQATLLRNGMEISSRERQETAPPFILYVGRLSPEKGIEDLLTVTEGLNLKICGDGPLRNLVPKEIKVGMRAHSEVASLYHRAACLILTSNQEGSPTSIIEAMACGLPVITTAVGDTPYLVEDGVTGYVLPIGDTQAMREKIEELLSRPEKREEMSRASRERIMKLCGWDTSINRLEAIYKAAIS
jgi:glycosyltransferase involved in cell wall biosynthesis